MIPMWRLAAAAAMFIGVLGVVWLLQPKQNQADMAINQPLEKVSPTVESDSKTLDFSETSENNSSEIEEFSAEPQPEIESKPATSINNPTYQIPTQKKPKARQNTSLADDENIPEPIADNPQFEVIEETPSVTSTPPMSAPKNKDIQQEESEALADETKEIRIGNDYEVPEKNDTFLGGDVGGETEEIRRRPQDALLFGQDAAQSPREIKGMVTDEVGEPLIGASVTVPGTSKGTTTDFSGNFALDVSENDKELEVSYTGYDSQIVPVDSQQLVQIALNEGANSLSEVTVTSKKKRKERTSTSAISVAPYSTKPTPKKGFEKFRKYLEKNQKYPAEAAQANIQGEVVLRFLVNENGTLSNIQVVKSLSPECDKEAIRVLKEGPKWEVGYPQETTYTFNFPYKN